MKLNTKITAVILFLFGLFAGNTIISSEAYACVEPSNFHVVKITEATAWLQWNRAEGASYYELQMAKGSENFTTSLIVSGNKYALLSLLDGEMYRFRVRSICSPNVSFDANVSDWTNLEWNNSGNHCPIPISLTASEVTSRSAVITWKTSFNADRYLINYRAVGEPNFYTIYSTEQVAKLNNLDENRWYEVLVSSLCANNKRSGVAQYRFQTKDDGKLTCLVPSVFRFDDIRSTSFVAKWEPVNGAEGYEVWYRVNRVGEWKSAFTKENQIRIENLLSNIPYSVKVRTWCNSAGSVSDWSTEYVSTVSNVGNPMSCMPPSNLNIQLYGINAGTITWYGTSGASKYEVLLSNDGKNFAITTTSMYAFANLPNLIPGRYWVKVRAICGDNASLDSPTIMFRAGLNRESNFSGKEMISVYPNPAGNMTTNVKIPNATNGVIEIFDMQGKEILTHQIMQELSQIDLSGVPAGMYLLKITSPEINSTTTLVVE